MYANKNLFEFNTKQSSQNDSDEKWGHAHTLLLWRTRAERGFDALNENILLLFGLGRLTVRFQPRRQRSNIQFRQL